MPAAQRPVKRGFRFSMKARTPSAASSLKISFCFTGSKSSVAATGPCSMALTTFRRVATTGGQAPVEVCNMDRFNQEWRSPYTATYYFYR